MMPRRPRIDWDTVPLGKDSDCAIARELGVSRPSVWEQRTKRGIPPFPLFRSKRTPEEMAKDAERRESMAEPTTEPAVNVETAEAVDIAELNQKHKKPKTPNAVCKRCGALYYTDKPWVDVCMECGWG